MTKADIINEIANETGVAKKDVTVVVESFMDAVKNNLLKKENVYLTNYILMPRHSMLMKMESH